MLIFLFLLQEERNQYMESDSNMKRERVRVRPVRLIGSTRLIGSARLIGAARLIGSVRLRLGPRSAWV